MCYQGALVGGKDLQRQLHLFSLNSIVDLPCCMHPAVQVLAMGALYASLTPGPGEHLSPCVWPSYASALRHVGQKAGGIRNVHAPHPASGVSRRTVEGMLFCFGRARGATMAANMTTCRNSGLVSCKQDPAKTDYDEAQLLFVYAPDSGHLIHVTDPEPLRMLSWLAPDPEQTLPLEPCNSRNLKL